MLRLARLDRLDIAFGDDVAAVDARAGPHVDDPVGRAHHRLVVLDDEDGVAEVAQPFERADEPVAVDRVQADRWLVADVEHAHERGADLRGEPDALRFAARERARDAVEREVVEPDVHQELEAAADLLEDLVGDGLFALVERRVLGRARWSTHVRAPW